jgi:TonB family protein
LIPLMHYEVIPLATPPTATPLPPEPPKVRPKVKPPEPQPIAELEPPKMRMVTPPPRPIAPKPKTVEVKAPELNPVFQPANLAGPRNEPRRPKEEVKTGVLANNTGSAAPATTNRPINQVQTGGFGDPNGLPGPGDPSKRANIARQGSFNLPGGPGYGNGTGGARGARGTVSSSGFGNGIAIQQGGSGGGGGRGQVRQGVFTDATVAPEQPKQRTTQAVAATTPVEITFKPNPAYTEEARKLHLEGDVLVEVVFTANGQVQVGRVVRGMGHGLDESALRAAQQIRFKPAKQNGQPVDFPAIVHIVFQLAY